MQTGTIDVIPLVGEGFGVHSIEPVARGAHLGALLAQDEVHPLVGRVRAGDHAAVTRAHDEQVGVLRLSDVALGDLRRRAQPVHRDGGAAVVHGHHAVVGDALRARLGKLVGLGRARVLRRAPGQPERSERTRTRHTSDKAAARNAARLRPFHENPPLVRRAKRSRAIVERPVATRITARTRPFPSTCILRGALRADTTPPGRFAQSEAVATCSPRRGDCNRFTSWNRKN